MQEADANPRRPNTPKTLRRQQSPAITCGASACHLACYDSPVPAARIHHLNCATMCPPLGRLVSGGGPWLGRGLLIAHVLLVETDRGLVLVDAGYGTADVEPPGRLPPFIRAVTAPRLDPGETALARVRELGFDPRDVRHLVVTHLDPDHAGGISDFPWATVHVHARELEAARRPTRRTRMRYLAAQLDGHERWQTYSGEGEPWMGLSAVRPLDGLDGDLALVPLFGHTHGHSGVAVRGAHGWLLHAGDAYYHRDELDSTQPPLLRLFQRATDHDPATRRRSQAGLRQLAREHAGEVEVFCAHDPVELERLRGLAHAAVPR